MPVDTYNAQALVLFKPSTRGLTFGNLLHLEFLGSPLSKFFPSLAYIIFSNALVVHCPLDDVRPSDYGILTLKFYQELFFGLCYFRIAETEAYKLIQPRMVRPKLVGSYLSRTDTSS